MTRDTVRAAFSNSCRTAWTSARSATTARQPARSCIRLKEVYGGLFAGAPDQFDVVLMNPPFGGKEGVEAQTRFAYKTSATQVLFLQHVIDALKPGGRCGMVIDEGVLFRTNEAAFVQTKRKLLDDCDLWAIVSLPPGVFSAAGAGVKTNLLFFTKGSATERVWYYDLSDVKVTKKLPLAAERFTDFYDLLPARADSERSWTLTRAEIEARGYDLKAVNPNARADVDERTPEELIALIEERHREVAAAIAELKRCCDRDRRVVRQRTGHRLIGRPGARSWIVEEPTPCGRRLNVADRRDRCVDGAEPCLAGTSGQESPRERTGVVAADSLIYSPSVCRTRPAPRPPSPSVPPRPRPSSCRWASGA